MSKVVSIRLSDDYYDKVKLAAGDMRLTDYLKKQLQHIINTQAREAAKENSELVSMIRQTHALLLKMSGQFDTKGGERQAAAQPTAAGNDIMAEFKKLAGWIKKTIEEGKSETQDLATEVSKLLQVEARHILMYADKLTRQVGEKEAQAIEAKARQQVSSFLETAKIPFSKL